MGIIGRIVERIRNISDNGYEFKPILSEIEERPINPMGRVIYWLVIFLLILGVVFLYRGETEVVISSRGVVIPEGEEQVVQSLEQGVVKSIRVSEGSSVKRGDELFEIVPREGGIEIELAALSEEECALESEIRGSESSLRIAQAQEKRLSGVRDIIPSSRYEESRLKVLELSERLSVLRGRKREIGIKRKDIESRRQVIKSPVDGYVDKLNIHTIGGVVSPSEKLAVIVPVDARKRIRAVVRNEDRGYIREGMPVTIKVDTYNYQKYGVLEGEVGVISSNSRNEERLGQVYEVYIEPLETDLEVEGKRESLQIGMTTTNEILIGKRRIIEFFIYPLIKPLEESVKEK